MPQLHTHTHHSTECVRCSELLKSQSLLHRDKSRWTAVYFLERPKLRVSEAGYLPWPRAEGDAELKGASAPAAGQTAGPQPSSWAPGQQGGSRTATEPRGAAPLTWQTKIKTDCKVASQRQEK